MSIAHQLQKLTGLVQNAFAWRQPGAGAITRAISISMIKNEQDVIEPFLRHNHKFFDAMIVLDNGSTDRTPNIIENCARELGGVFFTHLPNFEYSQSKFMTAALQYAQSAFFADFVCFLDADEFVAASDRSDFLDHLSSVPCGHASQHAWQTFLPDPSAQPSASRDWLDDMIYRRAEERPACHKCFIRLGGATEPSLTVLQGNHGFRNAGHRVQHHQIAPVPLRHFPVRSVAQIMTRGAVGWAANIARHRKAAKSRVAFQWKRLYELAQKGDFQLSPTALGDEAMAYAQDLAPKRFMDNAVPAHHGIACRRSYSDGQPAEPYRTIATSLLRTQMSRPFEIEIARKNCPAAPSDIPNAFDGNWHWQNAFLDVAPFRYLAQKYRPASVLDIGCGAGLYLRLMQHDGVPDILGLDGLDLSATALDAQSYTQTDLQKPFDARRKFDLVLCLEVAEHIVPDAMPVLLETIARHADEMIVFSMAEPGQPGNGHINCRTMTEVLAMWKARGWVPDLIETLGLRALATMSWFRRNLVVLRRGPAMNADVATESLIRISNYQYRWYRQASGIRQTAFEESFPARSVAYGRVVAPLAPTPAAA